MDIKVKKIKYEKPKLEDMAQFLKADGISYCLPGSGGPLPCVCQPDFCGGDVPCACPVPF